MTYSLTVHLDKDLKEAVARYAEATGKSQSVIASQAIEVYIRRQQWLAAKIAAARASETVSEEEAVKLLDKMERGLAD